MGKTLKDIHAALKAKFGDAVGEWVEVEIGDGWIDAAPAEWRKIAESMKADAEFKFDFLRCLSGVDYPPDEMQVVYHLLSYEHDHEAIVKVRLPRSEPKIASVADLWPAADWHEREAFDLLGIDFEGHPNLDRILLPDDWAGHPLRKDYKQPDEYHGVTNW